MTEESAIAGYTGTALKLLKDNNAKKGGKLAITTKDGFVASGVLIPRYEGGSGENIVLKLKSGYNIGIDSSTITSLKMIEDPPSETKAPTALHAGNSSLEKTVLLLSTGGTIASKVDYRTGAVKPAYNAADLYSSVPELGHIAEIRPGVVFSELSENLFQKHWMELAERIKARSKSESFQGIVIMLGTDTMAYVSAALSFSLIGLNQPVVCVGAQRSSDRPSADSALNLMQATRFAANSGTRGVFVAMHKTENDDAIAIHSGVRVRKDHTSRRDAFESIDVPLFAEVSEEKIIQNPDFPKQARKDITSEFEFKTNFDPDVFLLKFHPGFDPDILDYFVDQKNAKGFIIEGTGLGHVSSSTVTKINELSRKGIFVGIASQCIRGRIDLNVYETGIDLIEAGAIPLENMLSETAFVKLCWAFGNFPKERITKIMTENLVGEITERITLRPREMDTE